MKNLKESEKNFLTCAILIALVGIALVFFCLLYTSDAADE